jgi:hypothetical protein
MGMKTLSIADCRLPIGELRGTPESRESSNLQWEIGIRKSPIENWQSKISNRQSAIDNRQSEMTYG